MHGQRKTPKLLSSKIPTFVEESQMNSCAVTHHTIYAAVYCVHKEMTCCSDSNTLDDKKSFV